MQSIRFPASLEKSLGWDYWHGPITKHNNGLINPALTSADWTGCVAPLRLTHMCPEFLPNENQCPSNSIKMGATSHLSPSGTPLPPSSPIRSTDFWHRIRADI